MDYNTILNALERASHIQDEHSVDIKAYNNYVSSLKLLRELKNVVVQIDADDPDELLYVHSIKINWKASDLDITELSPRETEIIGILMNKSNYMVINHYDSSWILAYEICLEVATP